MHIALDIPDDLAGVIAGGEDPARAVLEATALEAHRSRRLGESAVRRLLGFGTRMQVYGLLKEHGVYLNYSMADLEYDIRESDRLIALRAAKAGAEQRAR